MLPVIKQMDDFSAVIIANNESKHISRCINSLQNITDDVVVVDSGSTDDTPSIARSLGARVFLHTFEGYGANKNFGTLQTKNNWIISLDGDEVLSPELTLSIQNLIPEKGCVYALNSLVNYCGKWIRHSGWYPIYKNRIFHKEDCRWNDALVHEDLTPLDNISIIKLNGDLWHYSYDSIAEHRQKSIQYGRLKGAEWIRTGKHPRLWKRWGAPYFAFIRSYVLKAGFLDGAAGFNIAKMNYLQYRTAIKQFMSSL